MAYVSTRFEPRDRVRVLQTGKTQTVHEKAQFREGEKLVWKYKVGGAGGKWYKAEELRKVGRPKTGGRKQPGSAVNIVTKAQKKQAF